MIASAVGGVRKSVREGETGLVTPAEDVDALRDRLSTLLSDPRQRARMGAAARALYEKRFWLERLIAETMAVYNSVLAKP